MVKMALNLMLPRQQFGLASTLHATHINNKIMTENKKLRFQKLKTT